MIGRVISSVISRMCDMVIVRWINSVIEGDSKGDKSEIAKVLKQR